MRASPLLLLALSACLPGFPEKSYVDDPAHDFDGDGFTEADGDCDDSDARAVPDAVWYRDADGDFFGDPAIATVACVVPTGFVADGSDCDDGISGVHPGAQETCTPYDDDCDGSLTVPDGAAIPVWHLDADADGFGDANDPGVAQCEQPAGYVYDASDCDDRRDDVRPRAPERCDGRDNDCDGALDDADPDASDRYSWYADTDGDGYGAADATTQACDAPEGFVERAGDCDDASAARHPDAAETCDGIDQDCDGRVDDGVQVTFYADLDGDGFGDPDGATLDACEAAAGFVLDAQDCDDDDADANPDAEERCNATDDDCDGFTDEVTSTERPLDAIEVYADADADGHGDASRASWACELPEGNALSADDCDDARAAVNPGATETCATLYDDDCDGSGNDPGALLCVDFHTDADADGYGTDTVSCQCTAEGVYTARVGADCDDADRLVNPGARERCSSTGDDDCDGDTNDIGADACAYFYYDADGDSYGPDASDRLCLCASEGDYAAAVVGDCDDTLARANPGGTEYCDDVDEDCDGAVDDDAIDATTWYADADRDGHGDAATTLASCDAPGGFVASTDDCDDTRPNVYPGATESCFNTYDDDCDGDSNDAGATGCTNWYLDADGDGYGSTTALCLCDADAGTGYDTRTRTDCDDGAATRSPGLPELCSTTTIDDDCDGTVNEADASGCVNYYTDTDGDGYGTGSASCLCAASGTRTATVIGDCDDSDRTVNPGAMNCGYSGEIDWDDDAISVVPDPGFTPAVATGDFNGDGLGDLAFGGSAYATLYADVGRVWVFYGPFPATMDLDAASSADLVLAADGTYSLQLGGNLAFGDFDGDGTDELLTSGVADTSTTARTVTALLYDYASTGTGVIDYASAATTLGTSYVGGANAWDVNGDGADDLLVGGTLYWGGSGAANPFTASGNSIESGLNQSEPIDLDGDGYDDVVTSAGVYLGAPGVRWTRGSPDVVVANGYGLRDWNADGYSDLAVGDPSYDGPTYINPYTGTTVPQPDWGQTNIYVGGPAATITQICSITGDEDYELTTGPKSGGDIDGDGRTDLWIEKQPHLSVSTDGCGDTTDLTIWYGGQAGVITLTETSTVAHIPALALYGDYACERYNYRTRQNWNIVPVLDSNGDLLSENYISRQLRFWFDDPYTSNYRISVLPGQPR